MQYTLIALPQETDLQQLNAIRGYLYTHGFRYTNKVPKDNVHITLAQVEIDEDKDINTIQTQIKNQIKNYEKIIISSPALINTEHTRIRNSPELIKKYPDGCSRIALVFDDQNLKNLAKEMLLYTQKLEIDRSFQYAQNIANSQGIHITPVETIEYLANHMNLCNYARLDTSAEAVKYIESKFSGSFVLDRVGLLSDTQELTRIIDLD